jgi:hypothetical protein
MDQPAQPENPKNAGEHKLDHRSQQPALHELPETRNKELQIAASTLPALPGPGESAMVSF